MVYEWINLSSVTYLLQDVDVECVAILNDTVGCLMSCAFLDHNTEVGVILGACIDFTLMICEVFAQLYQYKCTLL